MICKQICYDCPYSECMREKRAKEVKQRYYQRHKAERLAYQKKYNEEHKEQIHDRKVAEWKRLKSLRNSELK